MVLFVLFVFFHGFGFGAGGAYVTDPRGQGLCLPPGLRSVRGDGWAGFLLLLPIPRAPFRKERGDGLASAYVTEPRGEGPTDAIMYDTVVTFKVMITTPCVLLFWGFLVF